jgi:hypothetical protein
VLVFGFEERAERLEGLLIGALERAESGGAVRVLEVIFAGRDDAGELTALRLDGRSSGLVTALTDFRLNPGRHQRFAKVPPELEELGAEIAPGEAMVAVLVEHRWATALEDAVARSGGRPLAVESARGGPELDLGECALAAARASG